jgi:hypothetical protein
MSYRFTPANMPQSASAAYYQLCNYGSAAHCAGISTKLAIRCLLFHAGGATIRTQRIGASPCFHAVLVVDSCTRSSATASSAKGFHIPTKFLRDSLALVFVIFLISSKGARSVGRTIVL